MPSNIGYRLSLHNFILLVFIPFLWACAPEGQTKLTAADPSATPWQAVQIDGIPYHKGAGKASATAQQGDLSIKFSYTVRNGQAHIDAVTIGGVEYRADCAGAVIEGSVDPDAQGADEQQLGDIPHYQYCEDGSGFRDVDFTCSGYRHQPDFEQPGPELIRLKVEGNEDLLRKRFRNAVALEVLAPVPKEEGYGHPASSQTTYNLTDGDDDFFYLELKYRARYLISSDGGTDTWGDLYLDGEDGTIKPIAGSGGGEHFVSRASDGSSFVGNFYFDLVLDPGDYYLRVAPETPSDTGTYRIYVSAFEL